MAGDPNGSEGYENRCSNRVTDVAQDTKKEFQLPMVRRIAGDEGITIRIGNIPETF